MKEVTFIARPIPLKGILWLGGDIRGVPEFLLKHGVDASGVCADPSKGGALVIHANPAPIEVPVGFWLCVSSCGQPLALSEGEILSRWERVEG
jgi:hypothetical protein